MHRGPTLGGADLVLRGGVVAGADGQVGQGCVVEVDAQLALDVQHVAKGAIHLHLHVARHG
eukprot:2567834-Alexandrium_andersonii.AAC.1